MDLISEHDGNVEYGENVLASATPGGRCLQVIRQEDDALAITVDGEPLYRWPAARVESCVQVYLKLLRHQGTEAQSGTDA